MSDREIKELIEQQVQIQVQTHQQQMDPSPEIAELRQEIAEIKKSLETVAQRPEPAIIQVNSTQPSQGDRGSDTDIPISVEEVAPDNRGSDTKIPISKAPKTADRVTSDWMTAKEAFKFLGGNPGDRTSTISSVDGLRQIKFSTFISKTSSGLKPFGLELDQNRKRQRQPYYRSLKPAVPSDDEILQLIKDLDQQFRTDNYLPIFRLRETLQPLLSRDELDKVLYRLSKNNLIEFSTLQEVSAYTPEQIEAGIPQNVGGRLFFIIVEGN